MSNNPLVKKMIHGQSARSVNRDDEEVNLPPPRATWTDFREPNQDFNYVLENDFLGKKLYVGESFTPQGDRTYTDTTAIMEEIVFGLSDVNAILRPYEQEIERIRALSGPGAPLSRWRGFVSRLTQAAEDTVSIISGSHSYNGPPVLDRTRRMDRERQIPTPDWVEFNQQSIHSIARRRTGLGDEIAEGRALGTGPLDATAIPGIDDVAPPHMWTRIGIQLINEINSNGVGGVDGAVRFMRELYDLNQIDEARLEGNLEIKIREISNRNIAGAGEALDWIERQGDRTWANKSTLSFNILALKRLLSNYSSIIAWVNGAYTDDGRRLKENPVELIDGVFTERPQESESARELRNIFGALGGDTNVYESVARPLHTYFNKFVKVSDRDPRRLNALAVQFRYYDFLPRDVGTDNIGRQLATDDRAIQSAYILYNNFSIALRTILETIDFDLFEQQELARAPEILLYLREKINETNQPARVIISKSPQPLYPTAQEEEKKFYHTNFSLQVPVTEDDCQINDIMSNVETQSKTAKAVGEYRYFVNENLKFDILRRGGVENYPDPQIEQYRDIWQEILLYEKQTTDPNHENFNSSTYYGDLRQKTTEAFPRYGSLRVPTYGSGKFVDLLNRLGKFDNIENRVGNYLEFIIERVRQDDTGNLAKIFYDWYRASVRPDNRGWQGGDLDTRLQAMSADQILRTLEAQVEEFEPPVGAPGQPGEENDDQNDEQCSDLGDRIRRFLQNASSREILQGILDEVQGNLNVQDEGDGLFLPMILGDVQYTEPLFYRTSRKKLGTEPDTVGHVIENVLREGFWGRTKIYGGQYTLKPNFVDQDNFTFQDRFVDYADTYQYNVHAYTLAMRQTYSVRTFSGNNKGNHPLIDQFGANRFNIGYWNKINRAFDQPVGAFDLQDEPYDFTVIFFDEPDFEILKIPYVHEEYRDNPNIQDLISSRDRCTGVSFPPIKIVDSPPIPPEVEVIPYRGVDNKVLFMFGLGTGRFVEEFRYMTNAERNNFRDIFDQQKIENCDLRSGMVEFQSEGDDIHRVQIFRTTETPVLPQVARISNFGPEPYAEVERDSGSSFLDTIEPNVTYYYIFRSVDLTGNVSNPSRIFRVQMNSEDGLIFPVIDIYEPELPKVTTKYRDFTKHIEIRPSLLLSDPVSQTEKGRTVYKIGSRTSDQGGVFGKSFLIRLTSIDTGRKIDIKVSVSKDEVRFGSEEE